MNRITRWILQTEMGRRIEIQLLMNIVTSTLRLPRQNLLCKPSGQSLDIFATLTAKHLCECNEEQGRMLHTKATVLGRRLRLCLFHRNNEALTKLVFLLYRNIGINMEGHLPGIVIISKCHFCHYYSPHICNIASLMDSGVICGLFGEGRLDFTERITEGHSNCICKLSNNR